MAWSLAPRLPRAPRTLLSAKSSNGQPASANSTPKRPNQRSVKKQAPKGKSTPGSKPVTGPPKPKKKRRPKRKPVSDPVLHPDLEQFLRWLQNAAYPPLPSIRSALECDVLDKCDLLDEIIEGGSEVSKSVAVYNHVIEASVREGGVNLGILYQARATFDKMKEQGVIPNLQTYEWAIAACAEERGGWMASKGNRAIELLQEVKDRPDLEPTLGLYEDATAACTGATTPPFSIYHFCEPEGWEGALQLFEEMQANPNLEPTAYVYYSAIAACAELGKTQQGLELLREVEGRDDFDPEMNTYDSAYFRNKELQSSSEDYREGPK